MGYESSAENGLIGTYSLRGDQVALKDFLDRQVGNGAGRAVNV